MLKVYVWNPFENLGSIKWNESEEGSSSSSSVIGFGHAALQAGPAYISVWPSREGKSEPFFASRDYKYDRHKRIKRKPERKIELPNIPHKSVIKFWKSYDTPFHDLKANCCHVVAKALQIAKDEYESKNGSITPTQALNRGVGKLYGGLTSGYGKIIWTPGLIVNYAWSLKITSSE